MRFLKVIDGSSRCKRKENNEANMRVLPFRALRAQTMPTSDACTRQGPVLRPIITLSLNAPYGIPSGAPTAAVARVYPMGGM